MTSFLSYTIDSLKKRGELKLLLLTLTLLSFFNYYLLIISDSMTKSFFTSNLSNLLNGSIANYYGAFYIIIMIFGVTISGVLMLFIIRLIYFYQTKEIAVMIAIGGLIDKIQNFFLVQLMIMVIFANVVGLGLAYLGAIITTLLLSLIFPNLLGITLVFIDVQIIISFIIIFFSSYGISARLIMNSTKKSHETLNSDGLDFTNVEEGSSSPENNFLSRVFIFRRLNSSSSKNAIKLSRLNIMRRSFSFVLSLITTILIVFLLLTLIFGTLVISDSLSTSLEAGTGGNNSYMLIQQSEEDFFASSFLLFNAHQHQGFDLQSSLFNYTKINALIQSSDRPDDLKIDSRLLFKTSFKGSTPTEQLKGVLDKDFNPGVIKTSQGFIVGLGNEQIPQWNFYGQNPENFSQQKNKVLIGENLAWSLFDDPFVGRLYLYNRPKTLFSVFSIVVDPFLNGNTVYMGINQLLSLKLASINPSMRNMVLLNTANASYINSLNQDIHTISPSLTLIPISATLQSNNSYNTMFLVLLLSLSLPLIIVFILTLYAFSDQLITVHRSQMDIVKSFGGKKDVYVNVLLMEIRGYTFWGYIIGILLSSSLILGVVIPFPVISIQTMVASTVLIIVPWLILRKLLYSKIETIYNQYIY